eukprot:scaffold8.g1643.t1
MVQGGEAPPALLRLEVVEGPAKGTVLHKPGLTTVGRTRASQFHIKDGCISEKHAEVTWRGERWELRDVGSSNGTKLNGAEVESEGDYVPLKHGDLVGFGTATVCRVEVVAAQPEGLTVEQFVQAEVEQLEQRIRARTEQAANQLRQQWREAKETLLAAA